MPMEISLKMRQKYQFSYGMLTMNLDPTTSLSRLFLEIAAAMLVGVYYVGALIDKLHSLINKGRGHIRLEEKGSRQA